MRTYRIIMTVLCVALPAIPALAAASDTTGDEVAIKGKLMDFVNAWNKHSPTDMAAVFADDGTVINPIGREANGRDAVAKLFGDEQAGVMKHSTMAITTSHVSMIKPDVALLDAGITISGAVSPKGKAIPTMNHHLEAVMTKNNGTWQVEHARAFAIFTPPKAETMGRKVK
jgi:uncharacterized protein (TIGR02246 family)